MAPTQSRSYQENREEKKNENLTNGQLVVTSGGPRGCWNNSSQIHLSRPIGNTGDPGLLCPSAATIVGGPADAARNLCRAYLITHPHRQNGVEAGNARYIASIYSKA